MRRYAKALHQVAVESGKLDLINYQFDELKDIVDKNPGWISMMNSPMLSIDEKAQAIDDLGFDPIFANFLKLVSKKHVLKEFDELHYVWVQLARRTQQIAHLHLYLAKDITEAQEKQLLKTLEPRFKNQTISLHKTIDPNLIGGIKITHHGQSLDRSVARELEELFIRI